MLIQIIKNKRNSHRAGRPTCVPKTCSHYGILPNNVWHMVLIGLSSLGSIKTLNVGMGPGCNFSIWYASIPLSRCKVQQPPNETETQVLVLRAYSTVGMCLVSQPQGRGLESCYHSKNKKVMVSNKCS